MQIPGNDLWRTIGSPADQHCRPFFARNHPLLANLDQALLYRHFLSALCDPLGPGFKIHQFEDTGAIIAASTTSLPESPGSGRNWDYRYCWLRDTYYVITSLNHIGHFEEMEKYFNYVTDISFSEDFRYQPLYGITGQKRLTEKILDDLDGYMGNQPVRVGNQAYEHIQNDIYGQVLISVLPLVYRSPLYFFRKERFGTMGRLSVEQDRKNH